MAPQALRSDVKRDRGAGRGAGELVHDARAAHAHRGRLGSDALDAKRFEVVRIDLDAIDPLCAAGRRDDEIRRQAIAHEALVLDTTRRAIGVRTTERPIAEQTAQRERQE